MSEAAQIVTVEPMSGRIETYAVLIGGMVAVGWLRLARDAGSNPDSWIARTVGAPDGSSAAMIRKFPVSERDRAIGWLVSRDPTGRSA